MPKASKEILPVEIGMAHFSVFSSSMNMQICIVVRRLSTNISRQTQAIGWIFYIRQNTSICLLGLGKSIDDVLILLIQTTRPEVP
jgi:hypothetical protein